MHATPVRKNNMLNYGNRSTEAGPLNHKYNSVLLYEPYIISIPDHINITNSDTSDIGQWYRLR